MSNADNIRVLLFGGSGKLGSEIISRHGSSLDIIAPPSSECDITTIGDVKTMVDRYNPEVAINAAALVGYRECEENKDKAWAVNTLGAANIARICSAASIKCIFISSAAIFDGKKGQYPEDEAPNPRYYYAVTKVAAEQAVAMVANHVIVRVDMFPRTGFKYTSVLSDHYTSKVPMSEAADKIIRILGSDFTGTINIGQPRASLYDILKPYYPEIIPIKRKNSAMPDFPKDISLDLAKWNRTFGDHAHGHSSS